MSKYVIYCPGPDLFLCDNKVPFVGTEEEVKHVLKHEVVDPKRYEIKPLKFLKQWEAKKQKEEEALAKEPYKFSPPRPEFHYKRPENQRQYLLVLGKDEERKTGRLVKDFDTVEEAVTMALKSIVKLTKELPDHAYFILNSEAYSYVARISSTGTEWYVKISGSGQGKRESASRNPKLRGASADPASVAEAQQPV